MHDGFDVLVSGIPKAQPRPKAFRRGNKVGVYNPKSADAWKASVKRAVAKAWNGQPYGGPLKVVIGFLLPRPKAHFLKSGLREGAPVHHASKPDVDNLAKSTLDALTDLGVWFDDSQVANLELVKVYSSGPGARIILRPACDTDHIRC